MRYNIMTSIYSNYGLAPNRRQIIIWTNDGLANVHTSLGLNDLAQVRGQIII